MTQQPSAEVTAKPTVNVLNFQRLRDAIKAEEAPMQIGFDMRSIFSFPSAQGQSIRPTFGVSLTECGTTACICGWAYALKHLGKWGELGSRWADDLVEEAQDWLGLTSSQGNELFGIGASQASLNAITKEIAIDHLDDIIAAGRYLPWPPIKPQDWCDTFREMNHD